MAHFQWAFGAKVQPAPLGGERKADQVNPITPCYGLIFFVFPAKVLSLGTNIVENALLYSGVGPLALKFPRGCI
jgi:hypothetical protein